ncbi:hypothetical protein F511_44919 [Dorcoceras hygrometricum]|nr:hypothetical protein F511_44919 [Dorcoceras hygrometricum]
MKRISKCIEISLQYVFFLLDGKIGGLKLKELLFGGKNTPSSLPIPKGIPQLQQVAALPDNGSYSNLSRTVLTGKKRKQKTNVIIKKKPTVETQHATLFESRNRAQQVAGWDGAYPETQYDMARGRGGAQPGTAACWGVAPQSATAGCGLARQPISTSWGGVHQPLAGGWERTQQDRS